MAEQGYTRLGVEIVKASFKALFPSSATRIQAIGDIANAIEGIRGRARESRKLERKLQDAAEDIGHRLAEQSSEFHRVPEAERAQAVEGVVEALHQADFTVVEFVGSALDTGAIERRLLPIAERRWKRDRLHERAEHFGRMVLLQATQFMVNLVRDLPGFDSQVRWQQFVLTRKMDETFDQCINGVILPKYRLGEPHEVARFEGLYREDVKRAYKDMELFGLGVPPELRSQPVSIAYVTLQCDVPRNVLGTAADARARARAIQGRARVDDALAAAVPAGLSRGARVLLSGGAGSGKTTVMQWIAVHAAGETFSDGLAEKWRGCVPFIVQLRYVFQNQSEPTEANLIAVSKWRSSEVPGGWVRNQLESGRGVVVLDGLDELPERDRGATLRWIDNLTQRYPRSHYIVTSRPENLNRGWFENRSFALFRLRPMERDEVDACIESWYQALASTVAKDQATSALPPYEQAKARLRHDLRHGRPVAELAQTPLLCSMLCAIYAYKLFESAPRTRADLYERVINTLVDLRDRSRQAVHGEQVAFTLPERLHVLQALARSMTERQATTVRTIRTTSLRGSWLTTVPEIRDQAERVLAETTAIEVIEDRLRGMLSTRTSADTALRILLERSVVFREFTDGQAQFAHRTLQEFLAGRDYAFHGYSAGLLRHALNRDWHRTIVFAVAAARLDMADEIVGGVLDLADGRPEERRMLLLLTAECIGAARSVSPGVAARVAESLRSIVPPRTVEEADVFGSLGEEVLGMLHGHESLGAEVAAACVRAANLIGGPAALDVIAAYRHEMRTPEVATAILDSWQHFDPGEFARVVLRDAPAAVIAATSAGEVRHVHLARNAEEVVVTAPDGLNDFTDWADLPRLRSLNCGGLKSLRELTGLAGLPALRRLSLNGSERLTDVSELRRCRALTELHMRDCRAVEDLAPLAELARLRVLYLDNCSAVRDFSWLSELTELRILSVNGCAITDLAFCAGMRSLRVLQANTVHGVRGTGALAACISLERLNVQLSAPSAGLGEDFPRSLRALRVSGPLTAADMPAIGRNAALTELRLSGVERLTNLEFLASLPRLRHLAITDTRSLQSLHGIEHATELRHLDLSGSSITDLDPAAGLHRLTDLVLDGCAILQNLDGLADLEHLGRVSLGWPGVPNVLPDTIRRLHERSRSASLRVEHDPGAAFDYVSS